jgi:FkbM family methyltransferase
MGLLAQLRFAHRARKTRQDERDEVEALLMLISRGATVLDIGAYKGSFLFWMRRAVGEKGVVHAFEPQPELAAYLRERMQDLMWENVRVHELGLSSQAGSRELSVAHELRRGDPSASLAGSATSPAVRRVPVAVTTLDEVFPRPPDPSLIKCDVEGHELEVFRGGERLLLRARPVLLFEAEARHVGSAGLQELFAWLTARGYSGQFFGPHGLAPLDQFRAELHQARIGERFWDRREYCNNFLFRAGG